jgi:hypothetical protein
MQFPASAWPLSREGMVILIGMLSVLLPCNIGGPRASERHMGVLRSLHEQDRVGSVMPVGYGTLQRLGESPQTGPMAYSPIVLHEPDRWNTAPLARHPPMLV